MIQSCHSGDFETLMAETYPRIFKFALKLTRNEETARDLCQETFIRAFRCQKDRSPERDPMPWFFKITYNCFLDFLRMQSRRPKSISFEYLEETGFDREFVSIDSNPEQVLLGSQISSKIKAALQELPLAKQELIRLSVIESYSYAEMATMYGCSVPAIRTRIHRAVESLRRKLLPADLSLLKFESDSLSESEIAA